MMILSHEGSVYWFELFTVQRFQLVAVEKYTLGTKIDGHFVCQHEIGPDNALLRK